MRTFTGRRPMNRYSTNYANEVQQLSITVSKHLTVLKNGNLKWQWKAADIGVHNFRRSGKTHVVHYLIRDHFSGAFYAEVCTSNELIDVAEFLYRAWSTGKRGSIFAGVPDGLTVPSTVVGLFPGITSLLTAYGIELVKVTSGFQAGIRDVRTWEEEVRCVFWERPFTELRASAPEVSYNLCKRDFRTEPSKWDVWRQGLRDSLMVPKDQEEFMAAYRGQLRTDTEETGQC